MKKTSLLLLTLFLVSTPVHAHEGSGGGGFVEGFTHPVLGFDHLLAMISVGILSAQIGGRAIWTVPSTFVGLMVLGGALGIDGAPFPSVEFCIAFSVFALGIALAAEKKMPTGLAMVFVGFFGLFHGYAHGVEMPSLAKPVLYALGFVLATAGIHIAGVTIGMISKMFANGPGFLRYVGAGIAGIGFQMMFQ